jgi:hypothetical protein
MVPTKIFSHHVDWLLSKVLPVRQQLKALRDEGAWCVLSCIVWTSGDMGCAAFTIQQMASLIELGLEPQLAFTDYGPEE